MGVGGITTSFAEKQDEGEAQMEYMLAPKFLGSEVMDCFVVVVVVFRFQNEISWR